MQEFCVKLKRLHAMTTGMTVFSGCRRMSQLRPSSQEGGPNGNQASQVRKNLFGPIDHEENDKFVKDEMSKITKADMAKWNFNFQEEEPIEGRYMWQKVSEGVPQAYELQRMTYLSSHAGETTTASTTAPQQSPPQSSSSRVVVVEEEGAVSSQPSTSAQKPSTSSQTTTTTPTTTSIPTTTIPTTISTPTTVATTTTTTTTEESATTRIPTITTTTTTATTTVSEVVVVKKFGSGGGGSGSSGSVVEQKHTRSKTSQPPLTDFLRVQKRGVSRKRGGDEEQPPALVKRPKTTTS